MNWRYVLAVVLVAVIVFGATFNGGIRGDDSEDLSTGTEYDHASEDAPYEFTIDRTENCGASCREVTTTLTNNQDDAVSDVTITTTLYAGENTTESDALVWEGREEVGTLDIGESDTTTNRVDLSLNAASQLSESGGWVTIRTTVESDDQTVTFRTSREVS